MLRILALLAILSSSSAYAQATHHHAGMDHQASTATPKQPGEAAFAAIQEIIELLEADPNTDWSKVDIGALHQHLVDMSNVTLRADAKMEPVDGGVRFTVTGPSDIRKSIERMLLAHAVIMNGTDGWTYEAVAAENGANITVRAPAKDLTKLKGLGFMGVMTRGMHHQEHHLMIARGERPHG